VAYRIEYSPEAEVHLRSLSAHERAKLLDTVERQLAHQPTLETRNRKPMRPNPVAPWELRIRRIRVYYDVVQKPDAVVAIRAVGVKVRDRVSIGGEVVWL
jgi:mRNA-degrading endonuclease RelE of RelBE toxin-antitoxin system